MAVTQRDDLVVPASGPARPPDSPSWGTASWALLAIGAVCIVAHRLLGDDAAAMLYIGVGAASVLAVAVGIRWHRPAGTGPWYVLLAAQVVFVIGDVALLYVELDWLTNALYAVGYLGLLIALAGFLHTRQPGRARDSLFDAAIVVVGLGLVLWEFVVDPYQRQTGTAGGELLLHMLYPLLGLLLAGVAIRLLGVHGRSPAVWLLGLAMLSMPLGEVLRMASAFTTQGPARAYLSLWMGYYALVAAAGVHPAMRRLARRIPDPEQPLSGRRLAALVSMALLPPLVAVIEYLRDLPVNLPLIVAATLLLSMLIIARISDERRRALRQALRSMEMVELLQRVATTANTSSTIEEALERSLGDVCTTTGWAVGHVFRQDGVEPDRLTSTGIWHLADPGRHRTLREITEGRSYSPDGSLAHRALREGRPVWVPDVTEERGHARAAIARALGRDLGVRGHLAFPLVAEDQSLVVELLSPDEADPSERFLEVLSIISDQLRRVVERSQAARGMAHARDAALESSRLKSEFLATMSHEIRTPMNAVIGMTGLLLDTDLDPTQRWYASSVRAAGESLLTIIDDILDFSKIEAGMLTIETSDFSVDRLVEEVADLLGEVARPKGVDVFSYCHPEVPVAVRGDVGRLRQILVNLVGNAVKFTPKGEVIVRVRSLADGGQDPDAPVVLRFEVVDTGIGMSEERFEALFEPFVQADQSTTRRYGGTGLGLSITKRLVEIMGGEIHVESVLGEGSTFWFTLPLEPQADRQPDQPDRISLLAGRRVLILDDNPTNRAIVERQVAAWGMRPVSVERGPDAIQALVDAATDGAPFDVAVLDLNMPGMDGIEVARRIRADARITDVGLALLTSTEGLDEAARAEAAGVQAFLRKPVRQSQLYDALMQIVLPAAPEPPERPPAVAAMRTGSILLVEDNPANQLVGAKMTERLGYQVDVVGDGAAALSALDRGTYDAVLMDCQMPVMDGYEASRRIRASGERYASVPIIALTAGAMAEDRARCLAAGMDDYITKPVRPADLEAVLDRHMPSSRPLRRDTAPAGERTAEGPRAAPGSGEQPWRHQPVLDEERWEVLVDLTSSRPEALRRIVDVFISEAPARSGAIQRLEEPDVAMRGAHSLRGSAGSLGLVAVASLCEQIEDRLASGQAPDADLLQAVPEELEKARRALATAMEELDA